VRLPIFSKPTAGSGCRGIRIRDFPNSLLDRFELSVAIKRLECFKPTLVGQKRSRSAVLNFVENVPRTNLETKPRITIESGGIYELREQTESYGPNFNSQNEVLSQKTRFWNEVSELTAT